ncbi:MAG: hypothetical protein EHM42_06025 [Planctomycetaceae bacterium]|nr:MAG: hypothetical protein EHM42_06025 [Planctomycetaceae bacterium]
MDVHCAEYWTIDLRRAAADALDRAFLGPFQEETLARLLYALESPLRCAELRGLPGTGKTLLLDWLAGHCARSDQWVARIDLTGMGRAETVGALGVALGVTGFTGEALGPLWRGVCDRLAGLNLAGRRGVIIADHLDDAQPEAALEIARLVRLPMAGFTVCVARRQPRGVAPRECCDDALMDLADLRVELRPLATEQVGGYLAARWPSSRDSGALFTEAACDSMLAATGGVPRRIDRLSELCLLAGFVAEQPIVDASVVVSVAEAEGMLSHHSTPRVFEPVVLSRAS